MEGSSSGFVGDDMEVTMLSANALLMGGLGMDDDDDGMEVDNLLFPPESPSASAHASSPKPLSPQAELSAAEIAAAEPGPVMCSGPPALPVRVTLPPPETFGLVPPPFELQQQRRRELKAALRDLHLQMVMADQGASFFLIFFLFFCVLTCSCFFFSCPGRGQGLYAPGGPRHCARLLQHHHQPHRPLHHRQQAGAKRLPVGLGLHG
jgi:hypothetical protein